jgi:hypothetical protein
MLSFVGAGDRTEPDQRRRATDRVQNHLGPTSHGRKSPFRRVLYALVESRMRRAKFENEAHHHMCKGGAGVGATALGGR